MITFRRRLVLSSPLGEFFFQKRNKALGNVLVNGRPGRVQDRFYPLSILLGVTSLLACNNQPSVNRSAPVALQNAVTGDSTPPVLAPAFNVFHQQATIITLVVSQQTTDLQVESLIWLLRDYAHSRSLDSLKISQELVDRRDPIVWFQIYRGTRCADEHYGKGKLPCGSAEHEAGWYMYGNFASRDGDAAVVYHGRNETEGEALWQVNTPYSPKPFIKPFQVAAARSESESATVHR